MQEPANGARLKVVRTTLYGEDGYRGQSTYGRITDPQRNEKCSRTQTIEGGAEALRCLPASARIAPPQQDAFTDAACTQHVSAAYFFDYTSSGDENPTYAADADASGRVTAIYPSTGSAEVQTYDNSNGTCAPWFKLRVLTGLGGAIPLSSFVKMQVATE